MPKIAHFFWHQESMPFLHYATLDTFKRWNPDWEIRFYYSGQQGNASWQTNEHKYRITKSEYKWPAAIKVDLPKIHPVQQSDWLRWQLLSTVGGLWSDMDIIYFNPVPAEILKYDATIYKDKYYLIHFLYAKPNNPMFAWIFDQAQKANKTTYQGLGSQLFNRRFNINGWKDLRIFNTPMSWTCNLNDLEVDILMKGDSDKWQTPDAIAQHWYAGNNLSALAINNITQENMYNGKTTIYKILQHAYR